MSDDLKLAVENLTLKDKVELQDKDSQVVVKVKVDLAAEAVIKELFNLRIV